MVYKRRGQVIPIRLNDKEADKIIKACDVVLERKGEFLRKAGLERADRVLPKKRAKKG